MSNTKLILTHEVSGLGSAGDIVEVKGGYARNYLVPQGLATAWTRGGQKQVDQIAKARKARAAASLEEAQAQKARLEAQAVRIPVRTGQAGRLFGSVSTADVADAVEAAGLGSIDRRTVEFTSPVRSVGTHEATVRLREDVTASLTLEVVGKR
ncbi:50S ribosomal protein L9 [Amnibacterium soli]|jgi:large subunit ribosomal protein L9|uniref:Large ribosomal subunit protein bL9 n=1 Tax=Amnibacterium soli TaxID=1282736 RepID=A0ABP8Z6N6_9MICO